MFVYKSGLNCRPVSSREMRVNQYFHRPERWTESVPANSLIVVLSALLLGGIAKVLALPAITLVGMVLALAWLQAEGGEIDDQPIWMNRLSLTSTGLLYFGIGHCLGFVVLLGLPILTKLCFRS